MATFGERMDAIEERMHALNEMFTAMLQAMGLVDENGEWIEPEGDWG